MTDTVLAAVKIGPGRTELRELPRPSVEADAGLLRIEAAGICGSDVRSYQRPARHGEAHVMGHENVGTVIAIGTEAARRWGVREGDRVVLEEYLPCGECEMCRVGEHRFCEQTNIHSGRPAIRYGSTPLSVAPGLWGGFSELLYMHPASVVHPLDARTPPHLAALALPIANGFEWMRVDGGVAPGRSVLILGPGQQGLGCVVGASEAGAGLIVVAGRTSDGARLAAARALGAHQTIDVDREDAVARVRALTEGRGVDLVIDTAAANEATMALAFGAIKEKGGAILVAAGGMEQKVADFPIGLVKRKYATLKGVRGHGHDSVRRAIALIESGTRPLEVMATHRRGLDRVDEALRLGAEGGDAIHISIVPEARTA